MRTTRPLILATLIVLLAAPSFAADVFRPIDVPAPPLQQDRVEFMLPGKLTRIKAGGGGRYQVCFIKEKRLLVVFDVSKPGIVKQIPVSEDDCVFAAGADRLIVVLPANRVVQRWNLKTLEREATAPVENRNPVAAVHMGESAHGPVLLWS